MLNGGFYKMVILIIAVVLVGIAAYFYADKDSTDDVTILESIVETFSISRAEALIIFEEEWVYGIQEQLWPEIQGDIPFRPSAGQSESDDPWLLPNSVQFLGEHTMLIYFEDGHNAHLAILELSKGKKFSIRKVYKNKGSFSKSEYEDVVEKYGEDDYEIVTFVTSIYRPGDTEITTYDEYTRVPENFFLDFDER